MHIRENFFKNRVNTTNNPRPGGKSTAQNYSNLGSGSHMFNSEDPNIRKQAKSVKYHYYPDKQYAMSKHKSNIKIFKERNIRENQFCHSSGRVSDNLMDKLIGPDKQM
jgi:hypothetical protein